MIEENRRGRFDMNLSIHVSHVELCLFVMTSESMGQQ